jgi:hypothetical protein
VEAKSAIISRHSQAGETLEATGANKLSEVCKRACNLCAVGTQKPPGDTVEGGPASPNMKDMVPVAKLSPGLRGIAGDTVSSAWKSPPRAPFSSGPSTDTLTASPLVSSVGVSLRQ